MRDPKRIIFIAVIIGAFGLALQENALADEASAKAAIKTMSDYLSRTYLKIA